MTRDQAIANMRSAIQAIIDGDPVDTLQLKVLMALTVPGNLKDQITAKDSKADRYDFIIRWFRNDLAYKLSCGDDEDLGIVIDDKIEEKQLAAAAHRSKQNVAQLVTST